MLRKTSSIAVSAVALSISIFLLIPSVLFQGDVSAIDMTFGNFFLTGLILAAIVTVVLIAIAILLRPVLDISKLYVAIAVAIAVKTLLFPSAVPVLDGESEFAGLWSGAGLWSIGTIVLSLAIGTAAAFWLRHRYGLVVIVIAAVTLQPLLDTRTWAFDSNAVDFGADNPSDEFFEFSANNPNILVVLIDTLQSDVVAEILEEKDAFREEMDGFTLFYNTISYAPYTLLALNPIYSGRFYQGGPTDEYYRAAKADSIFSDARKAGYDTLLGGHYFYGICPADDCFQRWDLVRTGPIEQASSKYLELVEYGLLRVAPTAAQGWIYNGAKGRLRAFLGFSDNGHAAQSVRVIEDLADNLTAVDRPGTFKFLHLMTTHSPLVLDADCRTGPARDHARESYKQQAICAMRGFVDLLEAMKVAGIYDTSTIVLIGDHGASTGGEVPDRPFFAAVEPVSGRLGRFKPVFAIKPSGADAPFNLSAVPAQNADLRATLCAIAVECEAGVLGENLFALSPDSRRKREFVDYRAGWHHYSIENREMPERGFARFTVTGTLDALRRVYDSSERPPAPE